MTRLLIVCAWLACAAVAASCSEGGGGPSAPPFNPFGVEPSPINGAEPAYSDNEAPAPSGGQSITQLCAEVCTRIGNVCATGDLGGSCATGCATSTPPGCEREYRAFLECVALRQLECDGRSLVLPPSCESAVSVLGVCDQRTTTS